MKKKLNQIFIRPDFKKQGYRNKNQVKQINKVKLNLNRYKLAKYKDLTYYVRVYGCLANEVDGEVIDYILSSLGFKKAQTIDDANLVILLTCAIRENAENKVFGEIGLLAQNRKKNKEFKLGICGCIPMEEKSYQKIINSHNCDFIFGTHDLDKIPHILYEVYKNNKLVYMISHSNQTGYHELNRNLTYPHKAYISIMDGCDNFCTYCIVPYTRGQQISRTKNSILAEAKKLVEKGYKELTLIGQNVNSYGIDFEDQNYKFKDLLADVAKIPNLKRLRFSTSNPWNFDKEIIDVMSQYPNIMPYIHLPVQSGDINILKRMNRKFPIESYLDLIKYMRIKIKDLAITTDLIVGFPNESNKAFKNTLKLYKKVKYDNAYTFIFSPRIGTPAANMTDAIDLKTKQKRLAKLNKLVKKYAKKNNKKYLHQSLEVLVEGVSKTNPNFLTGYSKQQKVVNFIGFAKTGDIVNVKINYINRFSLIGEQIK